MESRIPIYCPTKRPHLAVIFAAFVPASACVAAAGGEFSAHTYGKEQVRLENERQAREEKAAEARRKKLDPGNWDDECTNVWQQWRSRRGFRYPSVHDVDDVQDGLKGLVRDGIHDASPQEQSRRLDEARRLLKMADCVDSARAIVMAKEIEPWRAHAQEKIAGAEADEARCQANPAACAAEALVLELCGCIAERTEVMDEITSYRKATRRTGIAVSSGDLAELAERERELNDRIDGLKAQYKDVFKKPFNQKACQALEQ